jgi:beta-fructofuranosidase
MLSRRELLYLAGASASAAPPVLVPKIAGDWWTIATDPDLGPLNGPPPTRPNQVQQPVDFAIWQAADGRWQLWSCIRHTRCGGQTRLFYRWQGEQLTDRDWRPMGIAMQADPGFGETEGGLQAPFVLSTGGVYYMLYGDWENICSASSEDGKTFARRLQTSGKSGMFGEGPGNNTRDPMVLRIGRQWHCYYTAYPDKKGAVYCRTSRDLHTWSKARIVAYGGQAGTGPFSSECPFVARRGEGFYLLRTQRYGSNAQTSVYRSRDPMDFGVDSDRWFLTTLPVAAPEIVTYGDRDYMAALAPNLKGIRMAKLDWVARE